MIGRERPELRTGPTEESDRRAGFFAIIVLVGGAAAYLLTLGASLQRLIAGTYWNSDYAGGPIVAERLLAAGRRGGKVFFTQPAYVVLDVITGHVPAHRRVWELWPILVAVATVAVLAWGVRRVATTWAAGVATVGVIAVTTTPLVTYVTQAFHGITWFATALAGFVVISSEDADKARRRAAAVGLALVLGAGIASDPLLAVTGLAPLVAVGALDGVRLRRLEPVGSRFLLIGTAVAAAAVAVVTDRIFAAAGFVVDPTAPLRLASVSQIRHNFGLFIKSFLDAMNGYLWRTTPDARILASVSIAIAVLAVFLASKVVVRAFAAPTKLDPAAGARLRFVTFWSTSALLISGAFLFSVVPIDLVSSRFLVPVRFALACLAPLALEVDRRRLVAALAATIVAITAAANIGVSVQLAEGSTAPGGPTATVLPPLIKVLEAKGLHRGYANYWYANSTSWKSHDRVKMLQVVEGPDRAICPRLWVVNDAEYRPSRGPTFLLRGPRGSVTRRASIATFGRPEWSFHVRPFTVDVYSYDIAARFSHTPGPAGLCSATPDAATG